MVLVGPLQRSEQLIVGISAQWVTEPARFFAGTFEGELGVWILPSVLGGHVEIEPVFLLKDSLFVVFLAIDFGIRVYALDGRPKRARLGDDAIDNPLDFASR